MSSVHQIPVRTSSKRKASNKSLEEQRNEINQTINNARKRLKARESFEPEFWSKQSDIEDLLGARTKLKHQISLRDFQTKDGGDESAWAKTEEAQRLFQEMKACELNRELCKKQSLRLQNPEKDPKKSMRSVFTKLFMTSPLGFALGNAEMRKKREGTIQSNFRAKLIDQYGAQLPDPLDEDLEGVWCPVLGQYFSSYEMTAGHLFPYRFGQETMDVIFGSQPEPELFSASNGLMLHNNIEKQLDQGNIVIVPYLPNNPSDDEIRRWHQTTPKDYKIRVTDINSELMGKFIGTHSKKKWLDLEGVKLAFKTEFRPRARYLYFLYCAAMLKRSWTKVKASEVLRDELGQKYWGTAGSFMKKNQLLGFVERMGHDYEELLEGAMEESGAVEADETALLAVTRNIIEKRAGEDEDESEDEDEDDIETETDKDA